MTINSGYLQALVVIALTVLTLHSYLTAPVFDGILMGPFSVVASLGAEYLISLGSWVTLLAIAVCKGIRNKLLTLYALFMLAFLIYSFPRSLFVNQFYVDTTGFMLEARHVAEYGWFQGYQGGLESLAHALFTGTIAQITGVNWCTLTKWFPHAFMFITMIGLLATGKIISKSYSAQFIVPLLFLGTSFFALFQYNRQSYAFPIHVMAILALLFLINKRDVASKLTFTLLFLGLLISHPGSSLNIVMLVGMLCLAFTQKMSERHESSHTNFTNLFLLISTIWLTFQLLIVGGSIISLIHQTKIALQELFIEPLPTRAVMPGSGYTPEGWLYIELRMRYGQFIIITSTILAVITLLRYKNLRLARVLSLWILSNTLGIGFLVYAKRWMQVPFMYLSLIFPLLLAYLIAEREEVKTYLTTFTLAILTVGILLQPILLWGPAPFMMPPSTDVAMGEFIVSHSNGLSIAHIGSHGLMPFYLYLKDKETPHCDMLSSFRQGEGFNINEVSKYQIVGVFFRMYAKASFLKFDPDIDTSIKELYRKLSDKGYSYIYTASSKEWVLFRK